MPTTTTDGARLFCFTISAKLFIHHDLLQPVEDALTFGKFQTDIARRLAGSQTDRRNTRTRDGAIILLPLNF
jgi:hypothetical protein